MSTKYIECVNNLGHTPTNNEFLSWTAARAAEYAFATGRPALSPNAMHTAEPAPDFEQWLCDNRGSPCWDSVEGDGAEQAKALVEANIGLVYTCAGKAAARKVMEFDDLVQEGVIGLIAAVNNYDWSRGNLFSTYTYHYVTRYMQRAIDNKASVIRIPVSARHRSRTCTSTAEAISAAGVYSLDEATGDSDTPLVDLVQDKNTPSPSDEVDARITHETLRLAMTSLKPVERQVLNLRFGLDDGYSLTLAEIGTMLGVSRERIRQIEANALRTLRMPIGVAA